ncbi:putative transcription regulator SWI/SNF-BAF60b family [Helianthus annuus]|uniref:Transcription regulator SWI/SNF-BAF60b family n=2 Tax=Helianthus annuus TaxID=4232 RepID=A0A9K3HJD7_HELAN|nr:putative transcription regulator SWI/SNF-BAF60b family [Helianthus annuus]KAJ0490638.1 putative transcription regulator SWI/SNF-BAF60b family [Helianthus annuus]KAJ0506557.1 putative transcription regulator SWI/SNF-BAF60b family [Helianthus annuus]KAJ0676233.1 putative transcription regulator SWI/SNF-BAF60b family [Helianthus annuus]KAJ0679460.1 putative transcription regulator SWI/SNF-BAF60b family [Helianthus annuus]
MAPIPLSEALVKFLGTCEDALARSDVVKRIWDYIKQNNLQLHMFDPADKRQIICDDKLKELFDVDTFNGFTVSKLLSTHFIKAER